MNWQPTINPSLCTGCTNCITQCPTGALGRKNNKAVVLHPSKCSYCATCEDICPSHAIELPYLIVIQEQEVKNE